MDEINRRRYHNINIIEGFISTKYFYLISYLNFIEIFNTTQRLHLYIGEEILWI